ncbi:DNA repair protein [Metschnikowia bicuspidata var. bicuspidata NRRL YB-4993]|uniref:DNA repair protein REV1 n=1 Tax=Metschnikowia bicuspidata var. bicuspidata NRRL YB-4993 TaxID=869754 RepID=A0A1A0HFI2_9ASCO|nr:DNA repair protein [Metschnikowia bicuspidata var. bicuspidata NRRL YB-4993]OBA22745.1 DNA repair protein [Metschnikowia bicuspidata var. bicuspidata NRRL YB-4993]
MADETYSDFLSLLNESQLIAHINTLSQVSQKDAVISQNELFPKTSDPFDDGLDSQLLKISKGVAGNFPASALNSDSSLASENAVPANQLALLRREDTFELKEGEQNHIGPQHQFGDYDTYFQNKYRKQQVSDRDFIRWEKQRRVANGQSPDIPPVFAGCKIFVNGNTTPTLATIHKLVILHGGIFISHLLNKGAATHIICDRLTPRKRVQYRNYRVVRAQWILDCVEQETLLDWKPYRLIDDVEPLQKRLAFLKVESNATDNMEDEHDDVIGYSESTDACGLGNEILDPKTLYHNSGNPWESLQMLREPKTCDPVSLDPQVPELLENIASKTPVEPPCASESGATHAVPVSIPTVLEDTCSPKPSDFSQIKVAKHRQAFAQMDARHPDFLKHFFANSRLHHLSTWKADLKSKFLRLVSRGYERPKKDPRTQPVILHIDFDCFFATASTLNHPNLSIKSDPIAVSHGGRSSDIASCNYVAREFGISNGMWLGRALEICPSLKVVDYDFESYERFSHAFYSYLISKKVFDSIFPVLIDEVLVDASSYCHQGDIVKRVNELCVEIRQDIFSLTKCPVSVGASLNVLLAKLALRTAKPDGHFYLHENIQDFLDKTDVRQLPGVGSSLARRLSEELGHSDLGSILIEEVRRLSLQRLIKIFGEKTGLKIFDNCHGRDQTSIHLDLGSSEALLGRKTVSVDVNYGIRFDLFSEAEMFLISLAKELHSRLIDLGVCGSSITLRLARRAPDAPVVTPKFLGLGKCVFVSRSSSLGVATNDWGILGSEMKALLRTFNIPPQDLRGIAVSLSKLEDIESVKKRRQQKLAFTRKTVASRPIPPVVMSQDIPFAERVTGAESIDWEVFNHLPEEIRRELKKELLRRGIPVSGKERSPSKTTSGAGTKVYLQQMFPTQPHGDFKVKRVVESPTKKKKTESPKKPKGHIQNDSPVRAPYDETVSYDEEVLNEIPSSIRNEFMDELEWQKKNKRLKFISMKTKMERKQALEKKIREQILDVEWLNAQKRAVMFPSFNTSISNFHDLVRQLRTWVGLTTAEEGPHPEDVYMFENYLEDVFGQGGVSRISNLLKEMMKELEVQENLVRLCDQAEDQHEMMKTGIQDWRKHMTRISKKFERACANIGISI